MLFLNNYKKWYSVGAVILCKTNKLLKQEIFNHKEFKITNKNNDDYELTDLDGKKFNVSEKLLLSNFESGYSINIHQAQGMTLKSYHWASEDNDFLNGNTAYTIISRIQKK